MARETLDAQRQLIDPVWGGVYQYSTDGDWKHPHFEKIMQMQAENVRMLRAGLSRSGKSRRISKRRKKFATICSNFLTSPDGAFYTSQDADLVQGEHSADYFALSDAERRKRGIPRVDQHIYARENGWAINALATLYAATGDESALNRRDARGRMDHRESFAVGWRISSRRQGLGRAVSRRFDLHGARVPEALCRYRRSEMAASRGRSGASSWKRNSRATLATSPSCSHWLGS